MKRWSMKPGENSFTARDGQLLLRTYRRDYPWRLESQDKWARAGWTVETLGGVAVVVGSAPDLRTARRLAEGFARMLRRRRMVRFTKAKGTP